MSAGEDVDVLKINVSLIQPELEKGKTEHLQKSLLEYLAYHAQNDPALEVGCSGNLHVPHNLSSSLKRSVHQKPACTQLCAW